MSMHSLTPDHLSALENYQLLIGTVIPRPIAFVTTLSEEGVLNAAPFSFFNVVSSTPPILSVSVQRQAGRQKDTARNAIAQGAFVVHICDLANVEQVNATSARVGSDVSEVELASMTPVASRCIEVPGVLEARVRFECRLAHHFPLPTEHPTCDLILGQVVQYHVDERIETLPFHIDPSVLQPVARLAGNDYSCLGEIFTIQRPR